MEKMKMETSNVNEQNIEKIAALFPNCVCEAKDTEGNIRKQIDLDALRQMLGQSDSSIEEKYDFSWVGKRAAIAEANRPIRKTLRPAKNESVNWDDTENLYIEGDNLEVLKLLQESYLRKIKMIYIDPPYNTGNDFIYVDDFRVSSDEYNEGIGVVDDNGDRLFKNTDTNGRFHSDWCSMIYSRLLLARNLLTEDGVIFISIDDNEVTNLRRICDEVFGESNFVDNIIWKKRYGGGAKEKFLVSLHEYTLMYCNNINKLPELFVPLTKENIERYYTKKDENYELRGGYRTHPLEATKSMDARPNLVYPIPAPDGTEIYPKRQWLWSKERAYEALEKGELEIYKGNNGEWQVATKQYLRDEDGTERGGKMFSIIENIYTQHGTNEMLRIFGNAKVFPFPKPVEFIKQLIQVGMGKDDIVLDFFSGSATTADAIMNLNNEDGGHRKFILVQMPEQTADGSDAKKCGYDTICDIGKDRIRKAAALIDNSRIDKGFRVFKVDDGNMNDVYYSADRYSQGMIAALESNIKADRNELDLLFGCVIDWGLPLSLPYYSETIDEVTIHTYNNGDLIVCFDKNVSEKIVKEIAKRQPLRAVFRDSSFANSPAKINVDEIFKLLSPDTSVKVL